MVKVINAKDLIVKLQQDNEFQDLIAKYESPNCFNIMGKTRREEWHSNFIKWLIDPKSNHKLGTFPLERLLALVEGKTGEKVEHTTLLSEMVFKTELSIPGGRVDIIGESESLIVLIENKLFSDETYTNGHFQTDTYFDYFEEKFKEKKKIYIYLNPDSKKKPSNKNFILITYQELYDHVINKCVGYGNIDENVKYILEEYMTNISDPNMGEIIAYTDKEIANFIYEKHKEAFALVRQTMNDVERDKTSSVCTFYKLYHSYINLVLGNVGLPLIYPRLEGSPARNDLIKILWEDGYINEDVELLYERLGGTYIIKVSIVEGKYKCYTGFVEHKNYTGAETVTPLIENGRIKYFDSIGAAAEAVETAHRIKIGKSLRKNMGPPAGDWEIFDMSERNPSLTIASLFNRGTL